MSDEILKNTDALGHGYCFIHPLEEYGLMDGYGKSAWKYLRTLPRLTQYMCQRGRDLSCGVAFAAKAVKPEVRIVGVNAENCPHFYESLRKGEPTRSAHKPTLADGIAAPITPPRGTLSRQGGHRRCCSRLRGGDSEGDKVAGRGEQACGGGSRSRKPRSGIFSSQKSARQNSVHLIGWEH